MTIKAQRQFFWGLIKGEPYELKPNERVILQFGYPIGSGDYMGSYGYATGEDTFAKVDVYDMPFAFGSELTAYYHKDHIRFRSAELLGGFIGYRKDISWEPSETNNTSPERKG